MKIWIYTRLSSDDDREGNSLANQRDICREYVKAHGYVIAGESADDNFSGMNFKRPGFDKLLKAAENGEFDAAVVKDISRLGRHRTQTALVIDDLRSMGVRVLSATEGLDTFSEEDDLVLGVRGLMNDYYAKDIGNKIRSGYRQKLKDGLCIIPPFGYWKDKNTNEIKLIDEAAETVRLIFFMWLDGSGLREIARKLNEQKRKTPAQYQAELYGRTQYVRSGGFQWSYKSVKNVLCDESYTGVHISHRRITENGKCRTAPESEWIRMDAPFPVIISRQDWEAAQERLRQNAAEKTRSHTNRKAHRYAGLLLCGNCGCPFVPMIRKNKGSGRTEYVCKGYHRYGKGCCSPHRIREIAIDGAVRNHLESLLSAMKEENAAVTQAIVRYKLKTPQIAKMQALLETRIATLEQELDAILLEKIRAEK